MAWAPDYTSSESLRAFVRLIDEQDNAQVALAIATASRAIDAATHRQFGLVDEPEPRYYTARYDRVHRRWWAEIDDLMDQTGLAVAVDTAGDGTYPGEVTAHALAPVNAAAKGRPWTRLLVRPGSAVQPSALDAGVRVTARWGWPEVPAPIVQACLLQASRL